jgi:NAD(P)-dependent dehydrogenase (short-subunit alcohol dehydrogenase family)
MIHDVCNAGRAVQVLRRAAEGVIPLNERLSQPVWLITGASSGLGHVLAEAVLERDGRVVATARDPEDVGDLTARYPERAVAVRLDVSDPEHARSAVQAGVAAFGRIDIVVNNAGYGVFGSLEDVSDADLRREFETNVFGAINVNRAALPVLRRQRAGHIVQISSLEGVAPIAAGESAYAATKFAVEGLSEALAKDVAHLGIRVMIVEPGPLRTDFAAGAVARAPEDAEYGESVGKALEWFADLQGRQPNDPSLVAAAVIDAVESGDPPLRLALGTEAVEAIREKLERQRRDLDDWEAVSASTAVRE